MTTSESTPPLTHLSIKGLTGVGDVDLRFAPDQRVYALIGVNGVGKTKCLEALFLWWLSHNADFWVWRRDRRPALVGDVFKQSGLAEVCSGVSSDMSDLPVVFLGATGRSSIDARPSIGANAAQSLNLGLFEARRQAYFEELWATIQSGQMAGMSMMADVHLWFVTRAYSANPYQKTIDNRKVEIDTVLELLHELDARIDAAFLEIDGARQVFIKVSGVVTRLDHLSSGFKSLLKMLQAIVSGFANFTNAVDLRRVRGIVLIDEIESHLHVTWQAHIVSLLKRLFPHTTFYIATHSPIVLSQLQQGEAYVLKRDETHARVHSHLIKNPGGQMLTEVLGEVFHVDMEALKHNHFDPVAQAEGKKLLLELLGDEED